MTLPSHERCQIVIPAQGMADVRDALVDILNQHGCEDTCKWYWQHIYLPKGFRKNGVFAKGIWTSRIVLSSKFKWRARYAGLVGQTWATVCSSVPPGLSASYLIVMRIV